MNRLVIIGNGFDLAHGLPTSYKDFLNNFWKNLKTDYPNDTSAKFIFIDDSRCSILDKSYQCYNDFKESLKMYSERYSGEVFFESDKCSLIGKLDRYKNKPLVVFKNSFFLSINQKDSINNWVDIEGEYYYQLKKIVRETEIEEERIEKVKKLHKEFDEVKELLEVYLSENVSKPFLDNKPNLIDNFIKFFKIRYLDSYSLKEYLNEFPKEDNEELAKFNKFLKENDTYLSNAKVITENSLEVTNLFVNFNYTNTITKYENKFNTEYEYHGIFDPINIHGELPKSNNRIIFGFGDEMDDDYSTIEKLDDNEYLKNFKSFQYSLNSNYKKLLDFIESNKFQVYIMGHSCGLSDRILLNTIFEHENCRSIKVFYRKKEDGTDNYTNLVQNISRHFNDKALMRKKLVNKVLCNELPQVKQDQ